MRAVRDMLARTRCVVLDFDGPVARLFAGGPSQESVAGRIAEDLLDIAKCHGLDLAAVWGCRDPHEIFSAYVRAAADRGNCEAWLAVVGEMQSALTAWELKSAEHAEPTPGAVDFIRAWSELGLRRGAGASVAGHCLAVASNNHYEAIRRYLERESLWRYFTGPVLGRCEAEAARMKPNPWILHEVMRASGAEASAHLMIGDSVSDRVTARRAGMPFLGYHRKPEKRQMLSAPGADEAPSPVIATMQVLADAAAVL